MRSIISTMGATLLLGAMTSPAAHAWYSGAPSYAFQSEYGGYFDGPTGTWNGSVGQPAVVNHYYSSGCYSCGGWAAPAGPASTGAAPNRSLELRLVLQLSTRKPVMAQLQRAVTPLLPMLVVRASLQDQQVLTQ